MLAKADSEVTSIDPSSPARSPHRPVYYVQSPSHDSHDGEKTATSFHSTPVLTPTGSPPHSHSSVGHHSRESSTSRFSDSLKPGGGGGSRRISPNDVRRGGRKHDKAWAKECAVIEEEGLLEEDGEERGLPCRFYLLAFVFAFFVLFSFFSLVLWGVSRSQKPQITMKSVTFENFNVQAGTDASGVPTDMVSMNATVKLTFRNTATFFGVHVSSAPVHLSYSRLTLGTGNIEGFYQSRKSQRTLDVVVLGDRIPTYGTGSTFRGGDSKPPVPLGLSLMVKSRAYVLGKLVKPKFYIRVYCLMVMDQNKLGIPVALKNSCQYN